MIRAIKSILPPRLKIAGRRLLLSLLSPEVPNQSSSVSVTWIGPETAVLPESDETTFINGDPIPPPSTLLSYGGPQGFLNLGKGFCQYLIDFCNMKPTHKVLDVGSGPGSLAIGLTHYLNAQGRYEGFDPIMKHIQWTSRHITSSHSNFHFTHIDLYNSVYNPAGTVQAADLKFPYPDNEFDVACLMSVFTHMLPNDIDLYLSEIHRVLKPGGYCLITYFLLNDESIPIIESKKIMSSHIILSFPFKYDRYRLSNPELPEEAIAYNEEFICELYEKHDLFIVEPIYYGFWCQRTEYLTMQDVIVARKLMDPAK